MSGGFTIPKFHSKDFSVLVASMLPMAVLLNYFLYGAAYFSHPAMLITATLVSFAYLGLAFLTYGLVAISLRGRFPEEHQSLKRLAICISIFFLMSAVYISLILMAYDNFGFFGYQYSENDFTRAYIAFIVCNVFLTFLNEGVYRFEKYRDTTRETEQLKKEYLQSQLLGLKSQMNPHFLFNSLNTLSSLIHEDAEQAEDFLDHMSKVYRYLLRNHEEQLVSLGTELSFFRSYFYLLKARHAVGLELSLDIPDDHLGDSIPPLTLQMILESIVSQNTLSRIRPLHISVGIHEGRLQILHNVQPKVSGPCAYCEAIENISNKYRLLCQQEIALREDGEERIIELPLITDKTPIPA